MYFCEETPVRLSDKHIPLVEELLKAHAIAYVEEAGVLRCELSAFGLAHSVVYVVSAENVFTDPDDSAQQTERRLNRLQLELFAAEYEVTPRKALYLFLVWDAETDQNADYMPHRWVVEQNLKTAKKAIMQPADVLTWLQNPFPSRHADARANAVPLFSAMRPFDFPGQKVPEASQWLSVRDELSHIENTYADPSFEVLKPLISDIYRRIMGSMYKVFWAEDTLRLGQLYDRQGVMLEYCSEGERKVFALAGFLARMAKDTTAGLCIGLPSTFDGVDALRQIGAYDCLRDFVASTGVSVEIQAAQSERRALALTRIRCVVEAAGGHVVN